VIFHFRSEFRINRPIWHRDIAKNIFNMASVRRLEFENFQFFFVKNASPEWKCASADQIWLKSDNSQLRYGDNAIFKLAAIHHPEFAKIALLVTWPVLACDSLSPFQISRWPIRRRDIAKKRFSIWRPSAILNLKNFDFFCQIYMLVMEICICL